MKFPALCLVVSFTTALSVPSCIMTNNPHYQTKTSYLDARYDQLMYLHDQKRLSKADYDEAYLLGTMYFDKKKLKEAKNLLKMSFDTQHTLTVGVAYMHVLQELGDKQEAEKIHDYLTILYAENEIQDQASILQYK